MPCPVLLFVLDEFVAYVVREGAETWWLLFQTQHGYSNDLHLPAVKFGMRSSRQDLWCHSQRPAPLYSTIATY